MHWMGERGGAYAIQGDGRVQRENSPVVEGGYGGIEGGAYEFHRRVKVRRGGGERGMRWVRCVGIGDLGVQTRL